MGTEMARFTVASVPYVNAAPLVWWFEYLGDRSPVRVVYDVPSRLPALLDSGDVQAILVSSVDALRVPGRRVLASPSVASRGAVRSVRLFSRVPFDQIKTLAWDASSMTSNRLATAVLREIHGVAPETRNMLPDQSAMLAECDACVLIGDIGMEADSTGLEVLDLGAAWAETTGLPFVWALWAGRDGLTPELGAILLEAWRQSGCGAASPSTPQTGAAIEWAAARAGWSRGLTDSYLNATMDFDSAGFLESSLLAFQRLLLAGGFDDCSAFPVVLDATAAPI